MKKLIIATVVMPFLSVSFVFAQTRPALRDQAEELRARQIEAVDARREQTDAVRDEMEQKRMEMIDEMKHKRMEAQEMLKEHRLELRDSATSTRRELAEDIHAKREMLHVEAGGRRDDFRKELDERRDAMKERMAQARDEFREKLSGIRDERKKEALERLDKNFDNVNARITDHFVRFLDKLEDLLIKIETRADKAETNGSDVADVRTLIDTAFAAIQTARDAVAAQAENSYVIDITTEDEVRGVVAELRQQLRDDLASVRETIDSARTAVHDAFRALSKVPRVDDEPSDEDEDDGDGDDTATTTDDN